MSDSQSVRVAAVQMDPRIGEVPRNRDVIAARLSEAAEDSARLVVFPECALTGYGFESRDEALPFAEPADGPSARHLAKACRALGVWVVYGFLESAGDKLFNACILIGPDGSI